MQRRELCSTTTACLSNTDCSAFFRGYCNNGQGVAFQWCTYNTQEYVVDRLDNFYLEVRGVSCETQEDDEESDGYSTFDAGVMLGSNSTNAFGRRYGTDLISVGDLINNLGPRYTAERIQNSGEVIFASYNWDGDEVDSDCDSELDLYVMPDIVPDRQNFTHERYEYMRSEDGSNELIRMQVQSSGLRIKVKGINNQEHTEILLILHQAGMGFLFLAMIPLLMDGLLLGGHPRADDLYESKHIILDSNFEEKKKVE